ncbi:MAG: hypothetical protein L0G39_13935, partial [Chryseobacterium sp.]|nr:hypothetical protein [Chryseobacterium sp.]
KFPKETLERLAGIIILADIVLLYHYISISDTILILASFSGIFLLLKIAIERLISNNTIASEFFIIVALVLLLFEQHYYTVLWVLIITLIRSLKDVMAMQTLASSEDKAADKSEIEKAIDRILSWTAPASLLLIGLFYIFLNDLKLIVVLLIFLSFPNLGLIISTVKMFARARALKDKILISDAEVLDELHNVNSIIFSHDVICLSPNFEQEVENIFTLINRNGKYNLYTMNGNEIINEQSSSIMSVKITGSKSITMREMAMINNKLVVIGNKSEYEDIYHHSHLRFLVGFSKDNSQNLNSDIISLEKGINNLPNLFLVVSMTEKIIKQNIFFIIPAYHLLAVITVLYLDLTIIQTMIVFLICEILVFCNSLRLLFVSKY